MDAALKYRPEIDGLRAIAVTAVVAGHVGLPGFSGGFVGVDVFFVISGFLITSILLRRTESAGRLDLVDFYARRIRRIVPAFALVVLVTLLAGAYLLPPTGEQQDLGEAALSSVAFASNLYFLHARAGYFAEPAQLMPLLHTWSLGVEEQFYIVWPLVVASCVAIQRRSGAATRALLKPLLVIGCLASLIGCVILMDRAEGVAFYFSPSRAWELGAGAILALGGGGDRQGGRRRGDLLCGLGLVLITVAVAFYQPAWMFVSGALLALLGAVCVIAGTGLAPDGHIFRLLASRPFVGLGKISYSWYLWHWPLLALIRAQDLGAPSLLRDCLIALFALVLAILTWRLVEQPALAGRFPTFTGQRRTICTGLLLLAVTGAAAIGLWASAQERSASFANAAMVREARDHPVALLPICDRVRGDLSTAPPVEPCLQGRPGAERLVVLWGDSHARHLTPGLDQVGRQLGIALMPDVKSGCRAFIRAPRLALWTPARRIERCAQFNREVMAQIETLRDKGLRGVILAARWSRADGWDLDMEATLRALTSRGLRVVVVADTPGYAGSVPACIARRGVEDCRLPRQVVDRARAEEIAKLRRIVATTPNVRLWDPNEVICPHSRCDIVADGAVLYSDAHHLSPAGSRYLAKTLEPWMAWVSGKTPAEGS